MHVRAWDDKKKQFHKGPVAISNDGVIKFERDDWVDTSFIPQVSLGLKDRNGAPVFPGDIVARRNLVLYDDSKDDYVPIRRDVVVYAVVKFNGIKFYTDNPMVMLGVNEDIEVVANIYENPFFMETEGREMELGDDEWIGNP